MSSEARRQLRSSLFLALPFAIAGAAMMALAFSQWRSLTEFAARALRADGVVVELVHERKLFNPVIEFTTQDGTRLRITATGANPPAYARGDHVRLFYESAHPKQARVDSAQSMWGGPWLIGGFGAILAAIGLFLAGGAFQQFAVDGRLQRVGIRVQARFDGVVRIKYEKRERWQLTCQWLDAATNKVYMFRSEDLSFDPLDRVTRDTLDVLINPDNPKEYRVDVSFLQ